MKNVYINNELILSCYYVAAINSSFRIKLLRESPRTRINERPINWNHKTKAFTNYGVVNYDLLDMRSTSHYTVRVDPINGIVFDLTHTNRTEITDETVNRYLFKAVSWKRLVVLTHQSHYRIDIDNVENDHEDNHSVSIKRRADSIALYEKQRIHGSVIALQKRKARRIKGNFAGNSKEGYYSPIRYGTVQSPIDPSKEFIVGCGYQLLTVDTRALTNKERTKETYSRYFDDAMRSIVEGNYSASEKKELVKLLSQTHEVEYGLIGSGNAGGTSGQTDIDSSGIAIESNGRVFNWDIDPMLDTSNLKAWKGDTKTDLNGEIRRCHFTTRESKHGAKQTGVTFAKPDKFDIKAFKVHVNACNDHRAKHGIEQIISKSVAAKKKAIKRAEVVKPKTIADRKEQARINRAKRKRRAAIMRKLA